MVRKTRILHYSLFIGAIGALVGGNSYSAVRIGNATRNNFYEQQMVEQQHCLEHSQLCGNSTRIQHVRRKLLEHSKPITHTI